MQVCYNTNMERIMTSYVSTSQRMDNNPQAEIVIDLNRNRGPKLVSENGKYNVMLYTTGLRRNLNNSVRPLLQVNEHGNYEGAIISLH